MHKCLSSEPEAFQLRYLLLIWMIAVSAHTGSCFFLPPPESLHILGYDMAVMVATASW